MVYETFKLVSRSHTLRQCNELADIWPIMAGQPSTMTLFRTSHPCIALLTTCRIIHAEATPVFRSLLAKLREQPVRFVLDLHALRALTTADGWLIHCFPSTSTHPIDDLLGVDNLPLDVRTFISSSYSFLSRTKHEPLSDARPSDVQLFLTQSGMHDQIAMLNAVAAHMSAIAELLDLSMAVRREGRWPAMLWPSALGYLRRAVQTVYEYCLSGIHPYPPQRPMVRLLPAPSEAEWIRDWSVGEVE